jgi:hypothetical protein
MEIMCNNKGKLLEFLMLNLLDCPWKGTLSELKRHLDACFFDDKKLPEYLKKKLSTEKIETSPKVYNEDEEETIDPNTYTDFNNNVSLKARLYQKNKELMSNVLNDNVINSSTSDNIRELFEYSTNTGLDNNITRITVNKTDMISDNQQLNKSLDNNIINIIGVNYLSENKENTDVNFTNRKRGKLNIFNNNKY